MALLAVVLVSFSLETDWLRSVVAHAPAASNWAVDGQLWECGVVSCLQRLDERDGKKQRDEVERVMAENPKWQATESVQRAHLRLLEF